MASELYDSFIADYYDESPVVSSRLQDVAFYRDAVREFGDPVLELGCGTGRITMALAEAGKRITGLDLSERMLERAVKKRAALRVEARNATLQEVLTALRSSFGLKIQASTSTDLNRSVSGTYNGSLREVITRLLDGYDFFVRKLGDDLEVVVVGFSASSGTAPRPEIAEPTRRPALRRDF